MAIFKNLFGIREIKTPVFYKDFKEENKELSDLLELKDKVKSSKVKYIERNIEFLNNVIQGEKNVYLELKNSSIPMICLHDIKIKDGDYIAQLDFIVITTMFVMILETKGLNGEIHINEAGDFVRYIKDKNNKIIDSEKVISPILQNNKNVKVVRDLLIEARIIKTLPIFSSIIVSNDKSIVNKSKAPKKVKYEIFTYDELTELINRKLSCYSKEKKMFEDKMKKIAEYFIANNIDIKYDYNKKYNLTEIIKLNPDNKKKLIQIIGFGPSKIDKYGQDIIDILRE